MSVKPFDHYRNSQVKLVEGKIHSWWWCFYNVVHLHSMGEEG